MSLKIGFCALMFRVFRLQGWKMNLKPEEPKGFTLIVRIFILKSWFQIIIRECLTSEVGLSPMLIFMGASYLFVFVRLWNNPSFDVPFTGFPDMDYPSRGTRGALRFEKDFLKISVSRYLVYASCLCQLLHCIYYEQNNQILLHRACLRRSVKELSPL